MRSPARPAVPKAVVAILLCLTIPSAGCLLRAAKGEAPITGAVHLSGNAKVPEEVVLDRLAVTGSGRWFFGLTDKHPFEPDSLPGDAKRIERIYQALGFYSAKVTDVRLDRDDGRVNVTFVVSEGPLTHVTAREITGLEGLPDRTQKEVLEDLPLAPGSSMIEANYEELKSALVARLEDHGYIAARDEGKVLVDPEKARATVSVSVQPGTQMRIARLAVFGAVALSRDRIVQASGLHPGELITPDTLTQAQRRIQRLGVFTLVQVEPGAPEGPGLAPVSITLHEAPFITVEAGGGLVSDPYRSIAEVRGMWTNKNLARGLQQLSVSGAVGYALLPGISSLFFGNGLQGQGVVGSSKVEFIQPRILRSPVDVSTAVDYTKDLTPAFGYQRFGVRVGFPAHLDFLLRSLTLTTSIAYDFYFDVAESRGVRVPPASVTSAFATSGCGNTVTTGNLATSCRVGYVEEQISIDRRDSAVSARSGWYLALDAQYANLPFSEFDYIRIFPELRFYVPLTNRLTVALRGRYGLLFRQGISGRRDLPGVAKFFTGGANSVRATGAQQLGPREFVVEDNPDASKPGHDPFTAAQPIPVGGDRLVEGSAELRFATSVEHLGLVLFVDAGTVANNPETSRDLAPVTNLYSRTDLGLGIRYQLPVGPVRLDIAYPLHGFAERPVGVLDGTSHGTLPPNQNPNDYLITNNCASNPVQDYPTKPGQPGFATTFHQCYEDNGIAGLQLFLSIGEAF